MRYNSGTIRCGPQSSSINLGAAVYYVEGTANAPTCGFTQSIIANNAVVRAIG